MPRQHNQGLIHVWNGPRRINQGGGVSYNFYVDSANGSDANDGTSEETAFQTLSAAQTALSAGKSLALVRGSYWREQINIPANDITIGVVGEGDMPVIDGADVVTSGWTQPDAVTYPNVWSRSWTRASATTTASEVLGVWIDGVRATRRADLTALQAGANGDWHTTSLTMQTSTVSIRSAADPNSDGILREITKRHYGINAHSTTLATARSGFSVQGPLEMKRCVGHYNAFAGGGTGKKLFLRDGNIHHTVTEGELLEDIVCTEISPDTTAGAPITHYRADGAGFDPVSRRCMVLFPGGAGRASFLHGAFTAHGSSPAVSDSYTVEQALVRGAAHGGGGVVSTYQDSFFEDWNGPCIETGSGNLTIRRFVTNDTTQTPYVNGSQCLRRSLSTGTYDARNCSLLNRKGITVVGSSGGTQPYHENCSMFQAQQGAGMSGGAPSLFNGVVWTVSGRSMDQILTGYTGDYNVFYGQALSTGPQIFYNGVLYNANFAGFQAASGQDANSVFCKSTDQVSGNGVAFWLGVANGENNGPPDGDWRINPNARVYNGAGATLSGVFADGVTPITEAGPQEHWDFNARAVVAGPPSRYPVLPATVAEMRTYIEDPTAWDFYP